MTISRPGVLTPEEARELELNNEPIDKIRRSPKYVWFTELAIKALIGIVWVLLAFIGNRMAENLSNLAEAVVKLQDQDKEKTFEIKQLKEGMNLLSMRQDSAVSTAQAAIKEFERVEQEVRMLQYYLLELDGKVMKAGIKSPEEAIAVKMMKELKPKDKGESK